MDKEQKAAFSDMGKQAAYLYNGALRSERMIAHIIPAIM